jgi:hypothetical protein
MVDHVNAVDADAVDLDLELQDCVVTIGELPDIPKRLVEEDVKGCRQVLNRQRLSDLRWTTGEWKTTRSARRHSACGVSFEQVRARR